MAFYVVYYASFAYIYHVLKAHFVATGVYVMMCTVLRLILILYTPSNPLKLGLMCLVHIVLYIQKLN